MPLIVNNNNMLISCELGNGKKMNFNELLNLLKMLTDIDPVEHATRRSENAERNRISRSQEDFSQTANRLSQNDTRNRLNRLQEDEFQTSNRLSQNYTRNRLNRSQEVEFETFNRLSENATRNR